MCLRDFFNNGLAHTSPLFCELSSRASFGSRRTLRLSLFPVRQRGSPRTLRPQRAFLSALCVDLFAAPCAFFTRLSAFISAISLLTELAFSKFQIASFNFCCAAGDSTPSASAANFSSITALLSGLRGSPLG